MRISGPETRLADEPLKKATPQPAAADNGRPVSDPRQAVQVTVSAEAQALANGPSGFDEAKVARLRSAVEAGTLSIDRTKIAQRIVEGD